MTLTRPFINNIPAFNADVGTSVVLNVLGGDIITGFAFNILSNDGRNRVIFTSNVIPVTNDIVSVDIRYFTINLTTSMGLTNNNSYKIQAWTMSGTEISPYSQDSIFYCYKQPTISMEVGAGSSYVSLTNGSMFTTSNPNLRILFTNLDLDSIAKPNIGVVNIYGVKDDNTSHLIYSNDNIYNFSEGSLSGSYYFDFQASGLSRTVDANGNLLPATDRKYKSFSLEYSITTIEGMIVTNNIYNLSCYYAIINNPQYLTITNLCDKGMIEINCTLTDIDGTSNPSPPIYINNEEVDLTETGSWVKWQGVFYIQNLYTLRLWCRNINIGDMVRLTSTAYPDRIITLKYNQEINEGVSYTFISLESVQGNVSGQPTKMFPYYIESQRIQTTTISDDTKLFVGIQEQEGLFDIDFEVIK